MAVSKGQFKKLSSEFDNKPLTDEELTVIKIHEDFIDDIIISLGKNGSNEVKLELGYLNFSYEVNKGILKPYMRKDKMMKELERRFKQSGWKIKYILDDGLDGLNSSGPDYFSLY